jgi:protease PrsW
VTSERSAASAPVQPTPVGTRQRYSFELPAFWLLVALLTIGAWQLGKVFGAAFAQFPVASAVAAVLFGLYAVPFVIFARSVDFLEKEPAALLATAAAWGGLVATTTAIAGNAAVRDLLAKEVSPAFATSWGPAIAAPFIEEVLKTLGVVIVVLIARRQVNSVLDGAVYGAFVGLGFQVVEDFIYAVNAVGIAGRGDRVSPVIVTFFLRGFLAGLWSHTLFSALAGAGVAYFVVRRNRSLSRRLTVAILAVLGAMAFHFIWNSPLLADGFGYGGWGILLALLIKGIPALLMIYLLVRAARGSEADFYLGELAALADPNIATPRELAVLRTGRKRLAARRYAYARCGRPGRVAVRELQRAQAQLAVAISRGGEDYEACRNRVLATRARLIAYGHPDATTPPGHRHNPWGVVIGVATAAVVAILVAVAINALGGR